MLGSQKALEDSPSIFVSHTYNSFMTAVLLSVRKHGGVVGVVVGDHVHSSFNAAKRCVGHARKAADSLRDGKKQQRAGCVFWSAAGVHTLLLEPNRPVMFLAQMPSISSRQTATAGTRQQPQNGARLVNFFLNTEHPHAH